MSLRLSQCRELTGPSHSRLPSKLKPQGVQKKTKVERQSVEPPPILHRSTHSLADLRKMNQKNTSILAKSIKPTLSRTNSSSLIRRQPTIPVQALTLLRVVSIDSLTSTLKSIQLTSATEITIKINSRITQKLCQLSILLPSLVCLTCQESSLTSLSCFTSQFKNLQVLDVRNSGLTSLVGIQLMPQLQELYAARNKIESIEPLLYCSLNLAILDLEENCIKDCESLKILSSLHNLQVLILNGNPCVENKEEYERAIKEYITHDCEIDDKEIFSYELNPKSEIIDVPSDDEVCDNKNKPLSMESFNQNIFMPADDEKINETSIRTVLQSLEASGANVKEFLSKSTACKKYLVDSEALQNHIQENNSSMSDVVSQQLKKHIYSSTAVKYVLNKNSIQSKLFDDAQITTEEEKRIDQIGSILDSDLLQNSQNNSTDIENEKKRLLKIQSKAKDIERSRSKSNLRKSSPLNRDLESLGNPINQPLDLSIINESSFNYHVPTMAKSARASEFEEISLPISISSKDIENVTLEDMDTMNRSLALFNQAALSGSLATLKTFKTSVDTNFDNYPGLVEWHSKRGNVDGLNKALLDYSNNRKTKSKF